MKPPIEPDDENASPSLNVLPRSSSLPSLSPMNTSVHVVNSTIIPVEITVEEALIQGAQVASLSAPTQTLDESQIMTASTNPTTTPDPRWPSKCRWSMDSPPPVTSTDTVSTGPEMSSKPTVLSNGIEDMRHQIDVNDLDSTLKDSSETQTENRTGVSDSGVEPEQKVARVSKSPPSTGLPPITTTSPEISFDPSIPKFVPSIGAWAKPLAFIPPATPPTPATPSGFDPRYLNNLLDSFWPTLTDGLGSNQKKKDHPNAAREFPRMPVQKIPVPELKEDGTLRFPWAARMDPSTRNLYRAAKPTFRHDGTPQVTIPSQVLRLGPENKKEYIIGHFHRCSLPPGGLIHAVVNRLWGRTCRIGCRKLSDSSYMFHIPHDSTRQWVIQRGVWHVDDCLLFVSPWKPVNSFKVPEVSTIPVWVNLKNVPDSCYSRLGLSHVASGLGEPMQTHKPRLDPTCLGEAKLLVEVELDKPFPKQIALDDKQGNIFLVDVEYTWIPSVCGRCGHLGHKEKRCLLPTIQLNVETCPTQEDLSAEEPQVEMEKVLEQSTVASDHLMLPADNSETSLVSAEEARDELTEQTLESTKESGIELSDERKDFSTPVNNLTYSKTVLGGGSIYWKNNDATKTNRNLKYRVCSVSGDTSVENVPFPRDYFELLNQAKQAVELALKDEKQLMEIEFPTSGLASVPGDGEGATEMTESMNMIREFCDRLISPQKARTTRIFFPEANEVKFAQKTVFGGTYFKLDYLTKPSLFEDFGFFERVKMADRVKPEDELFLVAYPYFNVNEMLVVEELYKEAVVNTDRKLIIFNGELDRIRSGYYPKFFYPKLGALTETLLPKMETVYYIHNFKGQKGGVLFRCYPGPWQVLRRTRNSCICVHQQETMPSLKEVALNILASA